ncbi:MAG: type II secretion system protein [Sutterella sp.]
MISPASNRRSQAGFTLLECVMVFVLMGAIGLIVSLCMTTAPLLIFRGATEEAAFRKVENCISRLDSVYSHNNQSAYIGLQALVLAGKDANVCPDVTVQFERVKLNASGKLVADDSSNKPSMLLLQVSNGDIQLVKIYAK